jgi:hypothetical protein
MSSDNSPGDPLAFVRNMWGNMGFSLPGMVTPTLDVDEIDKRITDLKAVENWLRMNLSMLQVTIQGMEMQKSTLAAVQAMSQMVTQPKEAAAPGEANDTLSQAAMWPWTVMQKMQAQMQEAAAQSGAHASALEQAQKAAGGRGRKKTDQ